MAKALIVFNAAHRETRLAAEEIACGISREGVVATIVSSVEELSAAKLEASGIVVLGSPASVRDAAREAHDLTAFLTGGTLDRKTVSVFDAGPCDRHGAGAQKLRDSLLAVDPALHLASPGISVVVDRHTGGLPEREVSRCRQFGEHLAGLARARGAA